MFARHGDHDGDGVDALLHIGVDDVFVDHIAHLCGLQLVDQLTGGTSLGDRAHAGRGVAEAGVRGVAEGVGVSHKGRKVREVGAGGETSGRPFIIDRQLVGRSAGTILGERRGEQGEDGQGEEGEGEEGFHGEIVDDEEDRGLLDKKK